MNTLEICNYVNEMKEKRCVAMITATHYNKRTRTIIALFDEKAGENIHVSGIKALYNKMRKPYLWYGCGYTILTKNNVFSGPFEVDEDAI